MFTYLAHPMLYSYSMLFYVAYAVTHLWSSGQPHPAWKRQGIVGCHHNVAPDALTCRSGEEVKDVEDNKNVVMLKPEHFLQVATSSLESGEESLENRIHQ